MCAIFIFYRISCNNIQKLHSIHIVSCPKFSTKTMEKNFATRKKIEEIGITFETASQRNQKYLQQSERKSVNEKGLMAPEIFLRKDTNRV